MRTEDTIQQLDGLLPADGPITRQDRIIARGVDNLRRAQAWTGDQKNALDRRERQIASQREDITILRLTVWGLVLANALTASALVYALLFVGA